MSSPFLFDWHENDVHAALRILHDQEPANQQAIMDVAAEMLKSDLFWHLRSRYDDALQLARQENDGKKEQEIELAMFARLYAAGSMQRTRVFQDVPSTEAVGE